MLRWRILLGTGLIAAVAALMVLDQYAGTPGAWLILVALVVGLAGAHELLTLLTAGGRHSPSSVIDGGPSAKTMHWSGSPGLSWHLP